MDKFVVGNHLYLHGYGYGTYNLVKIVEVIGYHGDHSVVRSGREPGDALPESVITARCVYTPVGGLGIGSANAHEFFTSAEAESRAKMETTDVPGYATPDTRFSILTRDGFWRKEESHV